MMKTKQDNDMIDHIGLVYIKNNIELSGLIILGTVYEESKEDNDVTNCASAIYTEKETI